MDQLNKKLEDKWYGPFEILKKIATSTYQLKLPQKWKVLHDVFNKVLLTPYNPTKFAHQPSKPIELPDILHTDKQIEEILDSKWNCNFCGCLLGYKVGFQNMDQSDEWVGATDFHASISSGI